MPATTIDIPNASADEAGRPSRGESAARIRPSSRTMSSTARAWPTRHGRSPPGSALPRRSGLKWPHVPQESSGSAIGGSAGRHAHPSATFRSRPARRPPRPSPDASPPSSSTAPADPARRRSRGKPSRPAVGR